MPPPLHIYAAAMLTPAGLSVVGPSRVELGGCAAAFSQMEGVAVSAIGAGHPLLQAIPPRLKHADKSARMAYAVSAALKGLWHGPAPEAVLLGSARGAQSQAEQLYPQQPLPPFASPSTTGGSLALAAAAPWPSVAQAATISSMCGSGLQALGLAAGLVHSGQARLVLAGASEAACTPFMIRAMQALRLYSPLPKDSPCLPLADKTTNTLALGDAAVLFLVGQADGAAPLGTIGGFGFSVEEAPSATGITAEGAGLQHSMAKALAGQPSLAMMHAPGTLAGDAAEAEAVKLLLGTGVPVYSNKFRYGHTLGASGCVSLFEWLAHRHGDLSLAMPYAVSYGLSGPGLSFSASSAIINTAGFGGGCGSVYVV